MIALLSPQAVLPSWSAQVELCKIDTERNPEVAEHFNVQALPTLILFRRGPRALRSARCCSCPALRCPPPPGQGKTPAPPRRPPARAACRDGQPVDRHVGLISGQDLDMRLRKFMK